MQGSGRGADDGRTMTMTTNAPAVGMLRHFLLAVLTVCSASAAAQQSRQDAWWTGPMLAPSAATLPQGHMLIEPYLYDVIADGRFDTSGVHRGTPAEHDLGSLAYVLYGLTDRVTAGMIPRLGYNEPAGAPNSSAPGVGDLTLQAGYGLTQFQDGRHVPASELVLQETVPTGRYDRLERASDGLGAGAYTTALALYLQDYFWMPNGRILRARLDLTYAFSPSVALHDAERVRHPAWISRSRAPGDAFTADVAAEYSVTRNWVLALDVVYQRNASTRVSGSILPPSSGAGAVVGPAERLGSLVFDRLRPGNRIQLEQPGRSAARGENHRDRAQCYRKRNACPGAEHGVLKPLRERCVRPTPLNRASTRPRLLSR